MVRKIKASRNTNPGENRRLLCTLRAFKWPLLYSHASIQAKKRCRKTDQHRFQRSCKNPRLSQKGRSGFDLSSRRHHEGPCGQSAARSAVWKRRIARIPSTTISYWLAAWSNRIRRKYCLWCRNPSSSRWMPQRMTVKKRHLSDFDWFFIDSREDFYTAIIGGRSVSLKHLVIDTTWDYVGSPVYSVFWTCWYIRWSSSQGSFNLEK